MTSLRAPRSLRIVQMRMNMRMRMVVLNHMLMHVHAIASWMSGIRPGCGSEGSGHRPHAGPGGIVRGESSATRQETGKDAGHSHRDLRC